MMSVCIDILVIFNELSLKIYICIYVYTKRGSERERRKRERRKRERRKRERRKRERRKRERRKRERRKRERRKREGREREEREKRERREREERERRERREREERERCTYFPVAIQSDPSWQNFEMSTAFPVGLGGWNPKTRADVAVAGLARGAHSLEPDFAWKHSAKHSEHKSKVCAMGPKGHSNAQN